MKKILFDTDVLIEHLRGNRTVYDELSALSREGAALAYTAITEAELYHGIRTPKEEGIIAYTLSAFLCLDIDRDIGRQAGRYLKAYSRSHGLDVADALIAAASRGHGYAICTFNWKHYPMPDLAKHRIAR